METPAQVQNRGIDLHRHVQGALVEVPIDVQVVPDLNGAPGFGRCLDEQGREVNPVADLLPQGGEGRHGEEKDEQDDPDELHPLQERQGRVRGPQVHRLVGEPQPDEIQRLRISRHHAEEAEQDREPGEQAETAPPARAPQAQPQEARHQGKVLEIGEHPNLRGEPSNHHQLRVQGEEADQEEFEGQTRAPLGRGPDHETSRTGELG